MGNWSENLRAKEKAEARRDRRKEKLSGLFFDFAKLCFGGLVVGIVIPIFSEPHDVSRLVIACTGIFSTVMFVYIGNNFLK